MCIFLLLALNRSVNVMSRRKLARYLVEEEKRMKITLKNKIDGLSHICLTADIWSSRHRSFLGVTVHWVSSRSEGHKIDTDTYIFLLSEIYSEINSFHIADLLISISFNKTNNSTGLSADRRKDI